MCLKSQTCCMNVFAFATACIISYHIIGRRKSLRASSLWVYKVIFQIVVVSLENLASHITCLPCSNKFDDFHIGPIHANSSLMQ